MNDKKRIDIRLAELGLVLSREKAQSYIMAGSVYVNSQKAVKPSQLVKPDDKIELRETNPFVSRGGFKLDKALRVFSVIVNDKICVDIGASTGGFTDVLLQNGARRVYAIDVGYGQLDWSLRNDGRVVVMERTNARAITAEWFTDSVTFACMDASFISIKLLLPGLQKVLKPQSDIVVLIKPQFEAGRNKVGKKGVVRDSAVHAEVIEGILTFCRNTGLAVCGLDFSPITGPEGNIEFLLWMKTDGDSFWPQAEDSDRANAITIEAKNFHKRNDA